MYKSWGEQTNPIFAANVGPYTTDSTAARQPTDSILRVDRAYVNWNNIGGQPIWFSIGRRPTTDGPPNHLKLNLDERQSTPAAYMDWPFDGLTLGYAYNSILGLEDFPGRVRFCFGRGFEAGLLQDNTASLNDTDFAGISWDVYSKGDRLAYLQSFAVFGAFNYPTDTWEELAANTLTGTIATDMVNMGLGARANIGNVYHHSAVFMDKKDDFNYFFTGAWSRTDPDSDTGMFNNSLTGAINTEGEDGWAMHAGMRYDIDDYRLKLGFEFNHGSEYWIGMAPGHDDIYASKLNTRGSVWEIYSIYDIPGGEAVSKFGKAFIRLGYQHYNYDYTGSGDWNYKPVDVESAAAIAMDAVTDADQVYLTFEAFF